MKKPLVVNYLDDDQDGEDQPNNEDEPNDKAETNNGNEPTIYL